MAGSKWLEIQRRRWARKDRNGVTTAQGEYPEWFGRMKVDGRWKWFKLFTHKRASQNRWNEIIGRHEQREAGVISDAMEHIDDPIGPHVDAYLTALKLTVDPEHHRIAEFMLRKLIKLADWRTLRDMTADSLRDVVKALHADKKTVSYANKFISRGKAFVHWLMQAPVKIEVDPFASVKRGNVKRAKKNRARRPLDDHESEALFAAAPTHRHVHYAFAMLAGLRRSDLEKLVWADVKLKAPIPHITLRVENTKNGHANVLPLHPRLVTLLEAMPEGMPALPVVPTVPDVKTLKKDLLAAGVSFVDDLRRRVDFHSLRHTHATNLDRTGCTPAIKTALTRHGGDDVEGGYTHAFLADAYEATCRLPDPLVVQANQQLQVKTGTNDVPETDDARRSRAGQEMFRDLPQSANDMKRRTCVSTRKHRGEIRLTPQPAATCLSGDEGADIVQDQGRVPKRGTDNPPDSSVKPPISDSAGHAQDTACNEVDCDLQALIDAWPHLPAKFRRSLAAMARTQVRPGGES